MNVRQLLTFCAIVDEGLKISAAAQSLHRSQPSITRQIQELELEVGIKLFSRRRNKLLALTPEGQEVLGCARRIIAELKNIHSASDDGIETARGDFTLATTHTQARYVLPRVIQQFTSSYRNVNLSLRQGTPLECVDLVSRGSADLAICSETSNEPSDLIAIPCYRVQRSVVVPPRHPLLRVKPLTLEAIARYPLITYDEGFIARGVIDRAFAARDLQTNVVLSAIDADVSKAYVELKIGIAILATIALSARDTRLKSIDARHLFPATTIRVVAKRDRPLRSFVLSFISLFAPNLARADVERAIAGEHMHFSSLPEL